MSEVPIEPGCPICAHRVRTPGIVMADRTRDRDGNSEIPAGQYHPRAAVSLQHNGSVWGAMLAVNFRAVTAFAGFVVALASIVATTYGAAVWVAQPRMRLMVEEIIQPLALSDRIAEKRMDLHLLEIAGQVPEMMETKTRILGIEEEIKELRAEMRDLERRVK